MTQSGYQTAFEIDLYTLPRKGELIIPVFVSLGTGLTPSGREIKICEFVGGGVLILRS
jgi:hypothetical protein